MRIDAHLHVWQDPYPDRPYPWTPDPFPAESMLPLLDQHGVDMAINVSPVMAGWDNSYGNLVAERYPNRFRVFGRIDPLQPNVEEALGDWLSSPGAAGVRLTAFRPEESRRLDDADMQPFWKAASDAGTVVAVFAPGRLAELRSVAESHQGFTLIIDHFGLGVDAHSADPFKGVNDLHAFAENPKVFLKVSAMPEVSKDRYPFLDLHSHLGWALREFGADRLIWGSNWPVESKDCNYRESYSWIIQSGVVTEAETALILGGTIRHLIDLSVRQEGKGD
jgi:L-fuconolactonase